MEHHTKPKFVSIFGQKENGKTTLACMIQKYLWENYLDIPSLTARSFANPLKCLMYECFGWTKEIIDSNKGNPEPLPGYGLSVRKSMEALGKTIRDIDPRYFLKQSLHNNPDRCIFDDGRLREEAIESRKCGGFNIFIVRESKYNDSTAYTETWVGSIARSLAYAGWKGNPDLRLFDYIITNNSNIETLWNETVPMLMTPLKEYLYA